MKMKTGNKLQRRKEVKYAIILEPNWGHSLVTEELDYKKPKTKNRLHKLPIMALLVTLHSFCSPLE